MKIASLAEVKARLSAFVAEAETGGPVVVTRNGKAVAVLLAPADDDDLEALLLSRSPRFRAILNQSRASIRSARSSTPPPPSHPPRCPSIRPTSAKPASRFSSR